MAPDSENNDPQGPTQIPRGRTLDLRRLIGNLTQGTSETGKPDDSPESLGFMDNKVNRRRFLTVAAVAAAFGVGRLTKGDGEKKQDDDLEPENASEPEPCPEPPKCPEVEPCPEPEVTQPTKEELEEEEAESDEDRELVENVRKSPETQEELAKFLNVGGVENPDVPNLRTKIAEGKTYLEKNFKKGTYNIAFLDPETGYIHVRTTQDKGVKRKKPHNGMNSRYIIKNHPDWIVVGNMTPRGTYYVPYSPPLDTPEVRKDGAEYMADTVFKARDELAKKGVKSKVDKSKLLTELFSPELVAQLLLIEHIDRRPFLKALKSGDPDRIKAEYNKVIVVTGLNLEGTYAATPSKVGATGFAQFMPSTYNRNKHGGIVGGYPEADLNPDFMDGMADHVNAVMAQYCLLDDEINQAPKARAQRYLEKHSYAKKLYLAAAYNCSPSHVNKKIDQHGANWRSKLPEETRIYLEKLEAVAALQQAN